MRRASVPFYLRSGKRLADRSTEIVVQFKLAPHTPFHAHRSGGAGQEVRLRPIELDYCSTHDQRASESPTAYEHLVLDALSGDPTLVARADEVETAWEAVELVKKGWLAERPTDPPTTWPAPRAPPGPMLCSPATGGGGTRKEW